MYWSSDIDITYLLCVLLSDTNSLCTSVKNECTIIVLDSRYEVRYYEKRVVPGYESCLSGDRHDWTVYRVVASPSRGSTGWSGVSCRGVSAQRGPRRPLDTRPRRTRRPRQLPTLLSPASVSQL